jgi:hypothetical protein
MPIRFAPRLAAIAAVHSTRAGADDLSVRSTEKEFVKLDARKP